jgi:hypothetical protein
LLDRRESQHEGGCCRERDSRVLVDVRRPGPGRTKSVSFAKSLQMRQLLSAVQQKLARWSQAPPNEGCCHSSESLGLLGVGVGVGVGIGIELRSLDNRSDTDTDTDTDDQALSV